MSHSSVDLNLPSDVSECLVKKSPLEHIFLEKQTIIESWFRQEWLKTPPPVTSSVDLRNEGFRLAPVDTNLFPAGFNNLNPDFLSLSIQAAQSTIFERFPGCTRIMIIPENHTRNSFYFESLVKLHEIFSKAGFEVRVGSLIENLTTPQLIPDSSLYLEPIIRKDNQIQLNDFVPCIVLLNNDFSDGIPAILEGIKQPIYSHPQLGWSARLKSQHFTHYQQVAETFSQLIGIDPWSIAPSFKSCRDVDFMESTGLTEVSYHVENLLNDLLSYIP